MENREGKGIVYGVKRWKDFFSKSIAVHVCMVSMMLCM